MSSSTGNTVQVYSSQRENRVHLLASKIHTLHRIKAALWNGYKKTNTIKKPASTVLKKKIKKKNTKPDKKMSPALESFTIYSDRFNSKIRQKIRT